MNKQSEYLVVGSIPDLVKSFMASCNLTPIEEIDESSFIVRASANTTFPNTIGAGNGVYLNKIANIYNASAAQESLSRSLFSDEQKKRITAWITTQKP